MPPCASMQFLNQVFTWWGAHQNCCNRRVRTDSRPALSPSLHPLLIPSPLPTFDSPWAGFHRKSPKTWIPRERVVNTTNRRYTSSVPRPPLSRFPLEFRITNNPNRPSDTSTRGQRANRSSMRRIRHLWQIFPVPLGDALAANHGRLIGPLLPPVVHLHPHHRMGVHIQNNQVNMLGRRRLFLRLLLRITEGDAHPVFSVNLKDHFGLRCLLA